HGCRSTKAITKGKYYYEVSCHDQGLCRIGWSTSQAALDLGTDKYGFGFGGTGKKSHNKQFDSYGEEFTMHDTMGCYLDLDNGHLSFSKNGTDLGLAFEIPALLKNQPFFASCVLKNAELKFNFGGEEFKNAPKTGFVAVDQAAEGHVVKSSQTGSVKVSEVKAAAIGPKALIVEPSKELAEQTLNNVNQCKRYVDNPKLRYNLLIIGGVPARDQLAVLEQGVDIVVGTPGRLDDLISTGKLTLSQVRFLVLDECDGLLTAGYTDFIMRIYNQIPQVTSDGKRLQVLGAILLRCNVLLFSTVRLWSDLLPCLCVRRVLVRLSPGVCVEMWSEAIKILKGEYTIRAIKEHNMDQAIIFCRTKIDCDNMEQYFIVQGGGPDKKGHQLSCVCLHGDRKPNERKTNLDRFKVSSITYTLTGYVTSSAYTLTGCEVAYTLTGCEVAKWYIHTPLLSDVEEHLKCTITQCEPDIKVPVDDFDGKVTYGKRRTAAGGVFSGHVAALAPTVQELANLEREAQTSFLHLGYLPNQLFKAF
uniref:ATP-dependent RNA helicase DDX1 n=1 Tax=Hucho hucho TaxID=62062 RepID=A0A4W5JZN8_9TELE